MSAWPQPFSLNGQAALITGGGSGLGLGMAKALLEAGARVVVVGRRSEPLADAVRSLGANAYSLVGDVTKLASLRELASEAEKIAGPITILVNNAGTHLKKPAVETSDAEFSSVIESHLYGAFALTREVGRRMVERRYGSVLFTASMASFIGMPNVVAYSAAKSAYVGVVRALSTEWGPHGVRVNAIAPGWIETPMLEKALANDPARRAKILGRIPLGGFGQAVQIGHAAVFLSSPAANYITGTILPVDGGAAESF